MAASARDGEALASALKRLPKTRRGRKIAKMREPQLVEGAKTALVIRGNKASTDVCMLLRELATARTPLATLFMRRHEEHPFEDVARLEALCVKNDHDLFLFGSSSKKRPFRVIFGRLFNGQTLDMQEFNVKDYKPISSFKSATKGVVAGSKPLVVFQGAAFEADESMKRTKSLLLDFFSGPQPDKVLLSGLDQVIVCSVLNEAPSKSDAAKPPVSIVVRKFRLKFMKSGSQMPRCELEEIGPRFSLSLDRQREPDRDRWKQAIKVPKAAKAAMGTLKVKNISKDTMGKKRAKIHLGKQNFDQIHTVHHGLSKKRKLRADLADNANA